MDFKGFLQASESIMIYGSCTFGFFCTFLLFERRALLVIIEDDWKLKLSISVYWLFTRIAIKFEVLGELLVEKHGTV